jgi:ribA/ribD-fused uncharacterized protein
MNRQTAIDRFEGEWAFLSNYWPCAVVVDGVSFPSVEHAYQAMKSLDPGARAQIRQAADPDAAKKLGRQTRVRPDWDDIKVAVMTRLVRTKFRDDSELADRLRSTGERDLVEGNHWGDRFWGVCEGAGENHLGRILMRVRDELRSESG